MKNNNPYIRLFEASVLAPENQVSQIEFIAIQVGLLHNALGFATKSLIQQIGATQIIQNTYHNASQNGGLHEQLRRKQNYSNHLQSSDFEGPLERNECENIGLFAQPSIQDERVAITIAPAPDKSMPQKLSDSKSNMPRSSQQRQQFDRKIFDLSRFKRQNREQHRKDQSAKSPDHLIIQQKVNTAVVVDPLRNYKQTENAMGIELVEEEALNQRIEGLEQKYRQGLPKQNNHSIETLKPLLILDDAKIIDESSSSSISEIPVPSIARAGSVRSHQQNLNNKMGMRTESKKPSPNNSGFAGTTNIGSSHTGTKELERVDLEEDSDVGVIDFTEFKKKKMTSSFSKCGVCNKISDTLIQTVAGVLCRKCRGQ